MRKVVVEGTLPTTLDDAPLERFEFSASGREASLEVDTREGTRVRLHFASVTAIRFAPMFDRRELMTNGVYRPTLLEVVDSTWLAEVQIASAKAGEPMQQGLKHYLVPSDDGVWEVLAKGIHYGSVG